MRALIDMDEKDIRKLDQFAKSQRRSRAAVIREAVADYIRVRSDEAADDAFGLWGDPKVDGLAYQEKIRGRVVKALFDTNILIDFLNGVPQSRTEMKRYDDKAISIISWMEVMVGAKPALEQPTRRFLDGFAIVGLTGNVAERAVALRRSHGIKLPDAVVWASADINSMLLVTRNTKDFGSDLPGIRIPYTL